MKRQILFFLSLSLVASIATGTFWLTKEGPVMAQSGLPQQNPFDPLNQKAKQARAGDLIDSENYVAEIINVSGFDSQLRGQTADAIIIRVGAAENHYRQGLTAGIPEARVVRTVNGLVKKFNLPDYAKTSNYEVRKLRLGLLPSFPQVIAQTDPRNATPDGSIIAPQMSPGEALFVLSMMLQQKLANPEYQLSPSERLARWTETHSHGPGPVGSPNIDGIRNRQLRVALNQAALTISIPDALQLSSVILNTLGIEN